MRLKIRGGMLYYFLHWAIRVCPCFNYIHRMSLALLSCNPFLRCKRMGTLLLKGSHWIFLAFMVLLFFLSQVNWCLLVCFPFVANELSRLRLCKCFFLLS